MAREKPEVDRKSITHHFVIHARDLRSADGAAPGLLAHDGYITVGFYTDGRPCELFIKLGSPDTRGCKTSTEVEAAVSASHTISSLLDAFGIACSIALQHGATLEEIGSKFITGRFEPSGHTNNEKIKRASSPLDYIFRWIRDRFYPAPSETIENT